MDHAAAITASFRGGRYRSWLPTCHLAPLITVLRAVLRALHNLFPVACFASVRRPPQPSRAAGLCVARSVYVVIVAALILTGNPSARGAAVDNTYQAVPANTGEIALGGGDTASETEIGGYNHISINNAPVDEWCGYGGPSDPDEFCIPNYEGAVTFTIRARCSYTGPEGGGGAYVFLVYNQGTWVNDNAQPFPIDGAWHEVTFIPTLGFAEGTIEQWYIWVGCGAGSQVPGEGGVTVHYDLDIDWWRVQYDDGSEGTTGESTTGGTTGEGTTGEETTGETTTTSTTGSTVTGSATAGDSEDWPEEETTPEIDATCTDAFKAILIARMPWPTINLAGTPPSFTVSIPWFTVGPGGGSSSPLEITFYTQVSAWSSQFAGQNMSTYVGWIKSLLSIITCWWTFQGIKRQIARAVA